MEKVERIFAVAEYIELINLAFKRREDKLLGEVSQVKKAVSGHVYFTLKDKSGEAVLDAVIWKTNYMRCGVQIEVGMELLITGRPQIYAPTGRFSFVAETIELQGEGALKKAYDELKKKLEKEGLFAPTRKRPIPEFINRIGVITSREGAVIHDFVNNLGKFGYKVFLVDSRVEGQQAVKPLIEAVHTLKKKNIEVLVIIRGGGSLESLQGFNNEVLVREITDFPVPVIAGIGHDQDVPLLALAADSMTSTPTAAAHLINRSWEEAYAKIKQVPYLLVRISREFERIRKDLSLASTSMLDEIKSALANTKQKLQFAEKAIELHNPTRQLGLGYSIIRRGDKIVKSIKSVKIGDEISVQLSDGSADTVINKINN